MVALHGVRRRAVVLALAATVAACATPPRGDVAAAAGAPADAPFELSGRLSARLLQAALEQQRGISITTWMQSGAGVLGIAPSIAADGQIPSP